MHGRMFMGYGAAGGFSDAVDFGGTAYMNRGAGLSGLADGKSGIFSGWCRIDAGDDSNLEILFGSTTLAGATSRFIVRRGWTGAELYTMRVTGQTSLGSTILNLTSDLSVGGLVFDAKATWFHMLSAWDLAAGVAHLYINDVEALFSSTTTNNTIDYTNADWAVGARPDGANTFDGCMAEIYFAPNQYLDLAQESNRRKFITASGKPEDLGADGSTPTGSAPMIYLHLGNGDAAAGFATNKGVGGDFTVTAGTLATASSSPSD